MTDLGMLDFTGKLSPADVEKIKAFILGTADAIRPKGATHPPRNEPAPQRGARPRLSFGLTCERSHHRRTVDREASMSHRSISGRRTAQVALAAMVAAGGAIVMRAGDAVGQGDVARPDRPALAAFPAPRPDRPALAAYPAPARVTGSIGVHDPSVVRAPNETYLLVATGANLAIKTSVDRIAWRSAGMVWPNGAPWTLPYTGGSRHLWAPDISFHGGQFYLYYSASTFASQRSAIFLATSPTGAAGSWTDRGLVIESNGTVDYNAIDPNLVVDEQNQWWLAFGSFWTGVKLIRLDPATGKRAAFDTAVRPLARRFTAEGSVEAPLVHRRGGFYYLFVSFDFCCRGAASTYRVMVGRSASITGPYVDRNGVALTSGGGTEILATHGSVHGPGHPAVLTEAGGEFLFYHYYADSGASLLGINSIGWDAAGWPFLF
jgi:arabinan endo-1,5-alpha-L-arabinosidase